MSSPKEHWVLTFVCPDQPGIVHAISGAVVKAGGNITESQQFTSSDTGRFFMRLQIEADITKADFEKQFEGLAESLELEYVLDYVGRPMRTIILATTADHCLNDLLYRQRAGQLPITPTKIFANNDALGSLATFFGVPFVSQETKNQIDKDLFEKALREFINENDIELIVLARYMQILSPEFCEEFAGKIINIHHSFLPAFVGANPYRQAHERGVKLIGATAHYATADLDEGPIIAQDTAHVTHRENVQQLTARGRDVETLVLSRAVRAHLEHKVAVHGHRTIVYS